MTDREGGGAGVRLSIGIDQLLVTDGEVEYRRLQQRTWPGGRGASVGRKVTNLRTCVMEKIDASQCWHLP
ncbi:hypothetical protein O3P69_003820 [Scylla paramamosain]|uniref:Uncharacterized protein n=1 Tax=Scylla paramamosain TaxID=85552 RepID=A0AAW0UIZ7_SCYPA